MVGKNVYSKNIRSSILRINHYNLVNSKSFKTITISLIAGFIKRYFINIVSNPPPPHLFEEDRVWNLQKFEKMGDETFKKGRVTRGGDPIKRGIQIIVSLLVEIFTLSKVNKKKLHKCEEHGAHLRISVWHLLMNLKSNYLFEKNC